MALFITMWTIGVTLVGWHILRNIQQAYSQKLEKEMDRIAQEQNQLEKILIVLGDMMVVKRMDSFIDKDIEDFKRADRLANQYKILINQLEELKQTNQSTSPEEKE